MGLSFVEEVLGTRVIRGEGQVAPKICRTKGKRWGGEGRGGRGRGWYFGYKDFWAG